MPRPLPSNIIETTTISEALVTGLNIDYDNSAVEIEFLLLKDDGTHHRRGRRRLRTPLKVNAFYNSIKTLVDAGSTTKAAVEQAAYDTVFSDL